MAHTLVIDDRLHGPIEYEVESDVFICERYADGIELWVASVSSDTRPALQANFISRGPRGGIRGVGASYTLGTIRDAKRRLEDAHRHLRVIEDWRHKRWPS